MGTTTCSSPSRRFEPLGQARSNVWLFSQLAKRLGFPEGCFRDSPDELIAQALSPQREAAGMAGRHHSRAAAKEGHIRLQFESEKEGKPFLPFAEGGFTTPSGKAEFYSETFAAKGLDPLPGICASP